MDTFLIKHNTNTEITIIENSNLHDDMGYHGIKWKINFTHFKRVIDLPVQKFFKCLLTWVIL